MKRADIDAFEKLVGQLAGLHQEISLLAKKAPSDAVNKFKLKFINRILLQVNKLLGDQYRPFPDFEAFSDEELPSNSDVTFIIAQYIECAEKLRADNIQTSSIGRWVWKVDDDSTEIRTASPKKIGK